MGLLLWVPVLNVFAWFALHFGVARLCFMNPVFMPVLAFGSSRYRLGV